MCCCSQLMLNICWGHYEELFFLLLQKGYEILFLLCFPLFILQTVKYLRCCIIYRVDIIYTSLCLLTAVCCACYLMSVLWASLPTSVWSTELIKSDHQLSLNAVPPSLHLISKENSLVFEDIFSFPLSCLVIKKTKTFIYLFISAEHKAIFCLISWIRLSSRSIFFRHVNKKCKALFVGNALMKCSVYRNHTIQTLLMKLLMLTWCTNTFMNPNLPLRAVP